MIVNKLKLSIFISCVLANNTLIANEKQGFYTIVDSQGRIINIPIEKQQSQKAIKVMTPQAIKPKTVQSTQAKVLQQKATQSTKQKIAEQKIAEQTASQKRIQQQVTSKQLVKSTIETDKVDALAEKPIKSPIKTVKKTAKKSLDTQLTKKIPQTLIQKPAIKPVVKTPLQPDSVFKETKNKELENKESEKVTKQTQKTDTIINQPSNQSSKQNNKQTTRQTKQQANNPKNNQTQDGFFTLNSDNEKYIDSDVLKNKAFNQTDKKRFYSIPTVNGSVDNIENPNRIDTNNQQDQSVIDLSLLNNPLTVSSSYRTISKKSVQNMFGQQCFAKTHFVKLKKLTSKEPLNLWPRPKSFDANVLQMDIINIDNIKAMSLLSFSNKANDADYYWPLVVFLDKQGCILEAVDRYVTQDIKATWLQKASLKGNLLVPKQTQYVMLTPMSQTVSLPNVSLSKKGALKIIGYDAL